MKLWAAKILDVLHRAFGKVIQSRVKTRYQKSNIGHENPKGTAINNKLILKNQEEKKRWNRPVSKAECCWRKQHIEYWKSTHFHSHRRILLTPTLETDISWSSGGRLDFEEQIREHKMCSGPAKDAPAFVACDVLVCLPFIIVLSYLSNLNWCLCSAFCILTCYLTEKSFFGSGHGSHISINSAFLAEE